MGDTRANTYAIVPDIPVNTPANLKIDTTVQKTEIYQEYDKNQST